MTTFVVSWDGDVDEFSRGISVTESYDGDVDIGSFFNGLRVSAWVRDDDQAGLFERAGDVVCEISWGKATGDCNSASMSGEFEDGALAVGAGRDNGDVGGIIYSGDYASSEDDFFPVKLILELECEARGEGRN